MTSARKCLACKKVGQQREMIRLTVDYRSGEVCLNHPLGTVKTKLHGRSAYLCGSQQCLAIALKGTRLKFALEGRRAKGVAAKRSISWPLEPQLIKLISTKCTEP